MIVRSSGRVLSESEFVDGDPIEPVDIVHAVEEIIIQGVTEQKYNFIVYTFQHSDATMSARTYLDGIETVSIFGPFSNEGTQDSIEPPAFYNDVLLYLSRRFHFINALDATGYELIWQSRPLPGN